MSTNMTTMKDAVYGTSEKEDMTSERTDEMDVWYVSGSKASTAYTVNLNTTTCMLLQLLYANPLQAYILCSWKRREEVFRRPGAYNR